MKNVKRYHCGAGDGMYESKEGYYVDYADYKDLLEKYNQAYSQTPVSVSVCDLLDNMNDCDMYRFRKQEACKFCKYKQTVH